MKKESLEQLYGIFREEARDHLAALEKGFLDLEASASAGTRTPIIDDLFRSAHSFKGAARAVGLAFLQEAGQALEGTLESLRRNPGTVDRAAVTRGLAELDAARRAFEAWNRGPAAAAGTGETEPRGGGDPAGPPVSPAANSVPPGPAAAAGERFTVRVSSDRLDRMSALAGEVRVSHRAGAAIPARFSDLDAVFAELLDRGRRMEEARLRTSGLPAAPKEELRAFRRRLESVRDQLLRLQSGLTKRREREDQILGALEDEIREARLLPIAMLTDSLRRVVRDLALTLGKSIRLETESGEILLDKAVIESLRDPFLHLVRNAADHGIESPSERRAAGKPEEGRIRIRAERAGHRVRITVEDDGRGVDYGKIRERLRRVEKFDETQVAALTEADLARFLFRPGFTTESAAGRVSGRGVGLDVVRDAVQRLQGQVVLGTGVSAGAAFILEVPVTISTVRILTVSCGGHRYGVPTDAVLRTGSVPAAALRELEGSPVLPVDGEPVPWIHLADLLGEPRSRPPGGNGTSPYLLIGRDGGRTALAVDDLEEESEVVLKPLGYPMSAAAGFVGGTLRPDGSVQIVLDVPELGRIRDARPARPAVPAAPPAARRVLIVDDSPTTRTFLRGVLTAAGYAVQTASDGVEALERLNAFPADLVVSDVDMPRMDGLDLTRRVKEKRRIPVILVTGMEKEEDRRQGLQAGADAYVVKSTFEGRGLLEIVKQLL